MEKINKNHLFSLESLNENFSPFEIKPVNNDKIKIINNIKLSIEDKKEVKDINSYGSGLKL